MESTHASPARDRWVQAVITGVRNIRGEMNISPAKALPVLLEGADQKTQNWINDNQAYLLKFGRFESIDVVQDGDVLLFKFNV